MISGEIYQDRCARKARPVLSFERARQLVREHGSPLLVISRAKLIESYWAMKQSMPGIDLYYAAKANPDPSILATLCAENAFVDICSEGELQAALAAGFTPDRMLHTHPCKTESNLRACYQAGVRWFVYDNAIEAAKIATHTPDVNLLLRVAVTAASSMINLSAKFGAPLEDAVEVLEAAWQRGLRVRGFSFHVGSQCLNAEDYCDALRRVRELWDRATAIGFQLEVLDIGGGFPAPYVTDVPSMASFGSIVSAGVKEVFGDLSIRIIAEPGRGICAESTTLVTQVIGKNTRWGTPWLFLDDGLYGSFSGIVFDHGEFPLLWDNDERPTRPSVIAGPTCDSGDIVCKEQPIADLEVGELLMVPTMGAYAGASACPFNGLPVARSILIE